MADLQDERAAHYRRSWRMQPHSHKLCGAQVARLTEMFTLLRGGERRQGPRQ
ncbi:MAG: hypothetical protein MZV70_03450 [Desulfobacterales bacterium]|nr:hypothetical protein [Desulfobacterales bacterium]